MIIFFFLFIFLRCLCEPLMTFRLHQEFILAASKLWNLHKIKQVRPEIFSNVSTITPKYLGFFSESDDQNVRVCAVHALIHKLPDRNKEMLELLIKHLVTYVSLPGITFQTPE